MATFRFCCLLLYSSLQATAARTLITSASAAATLRRMSCGENSASSLFFQPGERCADESGKGEGEGKGEDGGGRCPEASRRFGDGTTDVPLETLRLLGYTDDTPSCFSNPPGTFLKAALQRRGESQSWWWAAGGSCHAFLQRGRTVGETRQCLTAVTSSSLLPSLSFKAMSLQANNPFCPKTV